jgi:hypothetical protein
MHNKYLRDRAMRRGGRDMRNPYGSRGGYVRDSRMNRGRDYEMDYGHDYPERGRSDYRRYDREYRDERDYRDMEYDREYNRNYHDEAYDGEGKDYEHKLHEWINKLKKKDRFGSSKDDIIRKAKSMDVKFDKFDEDEFYATYLMMVSDYKHVANDPHHYLAMAKEWLMDDDVELTGSDKVCAYLYTIVLGEEY